MPGSIRSSSTTSGRTRNTSATAWSPRAHDVDLHAMSREVLGGQAREPVVVLDVHDADLGLGRSRPRVFHRLRAEARYRKYPRNSGRVALDASLARSGHSETAMPYIPARESPPGLRTASPWRRRSCMPTGSRSSGSPRAIGRAGARYRRRRRRRCAARQPRRDGASRDGARPARRRRRRGRGALAERRRGVRRCRTARPARGSRRWAR